MPFLEGYGSEKKNQDYLKKVVGKKPKPFKVKKEKELNLLDMDDVIGM